MRGRILEIQHFSVHDGPGIRTTVFFKGCQLRCKWCHNPECIPVRERELSHVPGKCIACGECVGVCPAQAHSMHTTGHILRRNKCTFCGACADACPSKALESHGSLMDAATIIAEALRDKAYYGDEGGITLSGGEAMLQPDFATELLRLARDAGIHTALETNLAFDFPRLDGAKNHVDLFLVDWKESDSVRHWEYTGVSNAQIRANLLRLHDEGHRVILRCPIVPGYNTRDDHFRTIAELTIALPNLVGAELLPYHNLGVGKIARFGLDGIVDAPLLPNPTDSDVRMWIDRTREFGGRIMEK